jgi:hypothetical protein
MTLSYTREPLFPCSLLGGGMKTKRVVPFSEDKLSANTDSVMHIGLRGAGIHQSESWTSFCRVKIIGTSSLEWEGIFGLSVYAYSFHGQGSIFAECLCSFLCNQKIQTVSFLLYSVEYSACLHERKGSPHPLSWIRGWPYGRA